MGSGNFPATALASSVQREAPGAAAAGRLRGQQPRDHVQTRGRVKGKAMDAERAQTAKVRGWAIDVLCILMGWALGLVMFFHADQLDYPFSSDSIKYHEAARNFLDGKGLVHSPHGPEPYDQELEPLRMFPPGYSMMIAAAGTTGMDIETASVWIPRAGWLVAVPVTVLLFRSLGLSWLAGPLALFSLFSSGVFRPAQQVLTDAPFLALAFLSLLLFKKALQRPAGGFLPVVASGLAAGLAYSVRNVGLSLLPAVPAALVLASLLRVLPFRRGMKLIGLWIAGTLPVVILLKLRALVEFGTLEPYTMPPSTVGLLANVRWMLYGFMADLTGSPLLSLDVVWTWYKLALISILTLLVVGLSLVGLAQVLRSDRIPQLVLAMAVVIYCSLGVAVVIVARTKYQWGELINERHAGQYTGLLLALVLLGLERGLSTRPQVKVLALTFLMTAGVTGRVLQWSYWWNQPADPRIAIVADKQAIEAIHALPANAFIVSNDGPFLTALCERSVRKIYPTEGNHGSFLPSLEKIRADLGTKRDVYVAFAGSLGIPDDREVSSPPPGFRLVTQRPHFYLYASEIRP